MPSAEEIQQYLTGVWRMMLGRQDGLKMLDLSVDGFWNSFFAMLVAAPPLIVGWVGFANQFSAYSDGFGDRVSVLLRVAFVDFSVWVLPLVALAIVAPRVGIGDRFVHLVVAGNWASALTAWIMLPPSLIDLFLPMAGEASNLLALVLFLVTLVLTWRLTNVALGKGPAAATAVFAGMFVLSVFLLIVLQAAFGLSADFYGPAG